MKTYRIHVHKRNYYVQGVNVANACRRFMRNHNVSVDAMRCASVEQVYPIKNGGRTMYLNALEKRIWDVAVDVSPYCDAVSPYLTEIAQEVGCDVSDVKALYRRLKRSHFCMVEEGYWI